MIKCLIKKQIPGQKHRYYYYDSIYLWMPYKKQARLEAASVTQGPWTGKQKKQKQKQKKNKNKNKKKHKKKTKT